jgi:competence protein ComEC
MKRWLRTIITSLVVIITVLSILKYDYNFKETVSAVKENENKVYEYTCIIDEFPQYDGDLIKLYCKITNSDFPCSMNGYKILVKVSSDYYDLCSYGSTIKFSDRITAPDTAMNYGNFSYREYLKSKNVIGIAEPTLVTKENDGKGIASSIYKIRKETISNIDKFFKGDEKALIKAIITGERDDLSDKMYDSYKKAGIYHIISVSGLHVGILITLLTDLLSRLRMKKRKKTILISIFSVLAGILFLMFTGYGISITRVIFMMLVLFTGHLFRRKYDIIISIITSAVIIANLFPYEVFSLSYQLSFLSTLGMCLALKVFKTRAKLFDENDYIITSLVVSTGVFIATMHVCSYNFGLISTASLVANIIIIPIATFLLSTVIGFCALSFILPRGILELLKLIPLASAKIINRISLTFSSFDISYIWVPSHFLISISLFAVPVILTIIFLKRKKSVMVYILLLIVIVNGSFVMYNINKPDKITFINAGKGESTYMYSKGKNILIDCGSTSWENSAEDIFIPYFNHTGINRIDKLFISYFDNEHTNAITKLMHQKRIKEIVLPPDGNITNKNALKNKNRILYYAEKFNVPISKITKDNPIKISDSASISLYTIENMNLKDKNSCAVYEILCNNNRFILSSCIGANGQKMLAKTPYDCTVLKIPSYGNTNKSTKSYIQSFSPEYAVITAPKENMYFKFDDKITKILDEENIKYIRTDVNKTITFTMDDNKIKSVKVFEGDIN